MPDLSPEILVVGANADILLEYLPQLRAAGAVTAVLPPRLALVRPLEGGSLPPVDGLTYATGGADPALSGELTENEQLFVEAWRTRFTPKSRRGDGLAWDAPGFEPPDSAARAGDDRP